MTNWNWFKVGIGLGIATLLMLFPLTRRIIILILPLGRGIDDLIFMIVFVGAVLVWGGRWYMAWKARQDVRKVNRNPKLRAWVISAIIVIVALTVAPTGVPIQNFFLMSRPITDPSFPIWLAVEIAVVAITWLILGRSSKKGKQK